MANSNPLDAYLAPHLLSNNGATPVPQRPYFLLPPGFVASDDPTFVDPLSGEVVGATVLTPGPSGAAGGSLGGTYPDPTVVQVDGAGVSDVTGSGTVLPIMSVETWLGYANAAGAAFAVKGFCGSGTPPVTTDGTTWVTVATLTPNSTLQVSRVTMSLCGGDSANNAVTGDLSFSYKLIGSTFTIYGSPALTNILGDAALSSVAAQVVASGGSLLVQVKGVAAHSIIWFMFGQDGLL